MDAKIIVVFADRPARGLGAPRERQTLGAKPRNPREGDRDNRLRALGAQDENKQTLNPRSNPRCQTPQPEAQDEKTLLLLYYSRA